LRINILINLCVFFIDRKNPNLGVSLLGGNAYGIFIHSVQKDSIADDVGLRVGDQILEYNGTDLKRATAEYAAFELAKPADKVTAMVQYNIQSKLRKLSCCNLRT
jgi:S1-C subfamily serine protease